MTFYSKSLAKRLIQSTSASEDMESNMIAKLKVNYFFKKIIEVILFF